MVVELEKSCCHLATAKINTLNENMVILLKISNASKTFFEQLDFLPTRVIDEFVMQNAAKIIWNFAIYNSRFIATNNI